MDCTLTWIYGPQINYNYNYNQYLSDQYCYLLLTSICQANTATWCYQLFFRPILLSAAYQYLSDQYSNLLLTSICHTKTATWC